MGVFMRRRGVLCLLLLLFSGPYVLSEAQQLGGRMHQSNIRLNKLRAGTLANCGTNNFVSGFRPDGTAICATLSLATLTDGSSVVTLTGAQRVRNKQNVARVVPQTIVSGPPNNITPNVDTTDIATLDAIPADLTINAPVGTGGNPEPEQELEFRFLCATSRALTWHVIYANENGIPLPTACLGNGFYNRIKYRFNAVSAKWGLIATTVGVGRGLTTLASNATYTCNPALAESCEMQNTLTAGTGVTLAIPAGTYTNGMKVLMRIRCTGTQALTLPTGTFLGSTTVPLTGMSCTSNSYWTQLGFIFSGVDSRWQLHAFVN